MVLRRLSQRIFLKLGKKSGLYPLIHPSDISFCERFPPETGRKIAQNWNQKQSESCRTKYIIFGKFKYKFFKRVKKSLRACRNDQWQSWIMEKLVASDIDLFSRFFFEKIFGWVPAWSVIVDEIDIFSPKIGRNIHFSKTSSTWISCLMVHYFSTKRLLLHT